MRRTVMAVLWVLVGACGPDRVLEVADNFKTIDELQMAPSYDWGNSSSTSVNPTGSNVFPRPLTIRVRVYDICGHDDGDQCDVPLASASVQVFSGAEACNVSIPTSCDEDSCLTQLEMTGLGDCMLAVNAKTHGGDVESTCWYRAVFEADDPFDDTVFDRHVAEVDAEAERCNDSL